MTSRCQPVESDDEFHSCWLVSGITQTQTHAHKHTHRHKHTHTYIQTQTHIPLSLSNRKGSPCPNLVYWCLSPCLWLTLCLRVLVPVCVHRLFLLPLIMSVCFLSILHQLTVMIVCPSYPIISFFAFYSSCHSRVNTSIFLASVSLTQCCLCHTHTHTHPHTHTHEHTHAPTHTYTHTYKKHDLSNNWHLSVVTFVMILWLCGIYVQFHELVDFFYVRHWPY